MICDIIHFTVVGCAVKMGERGKCLWCNDYIVVIYFGICADKSMTGEWVLHYRCFAADFGIV